MALSVVDVRSHKIQLNIALTSTQLMCMWCIAKSFYRLVGQWTWFKKIENLFILVVRKPYLYIFKANIAMISNCLCACPICNLRPSLHFFFFSPLNAVKDNCILISLSSCRDRKTCFKQGKCWSFPTTQRKKRKKVDDTSNIFGIRSEICCVHQLWHSINFQITFLLLLQHSEMKFLKMNEVTQLTPFIFFSSNAGREKKKIF